MDCSGDQPFPSRGDPVRLSTLPKLPVVGIETFDVDTCRVAWCVFFLASVFLHVVSAALAAREGKKRRGNRPVDISSVGGGQNDIMRRLLLDEDVTRDDL